MAAAIIDFIIDGLKNINKLFGGGASKFIMSLERGKGSLSDASASPVGAQTSNSIINGGSRSQNVSIGEVNVHTQATDADGISDAMGKSLYDMLTQSNDQFDNGVLA